MVEAGVKIVKIANAPDLHACGVVESRCLVLTVCEYSADKIRITAM